MNHELVHVATGDIAIEEDRRWRRFFLGKVAARAGEPRVAPLQLPHGPALHRAALVHRGQRGVLRDLDGRRARARAGRLRRDGVPRDGARRRALLRSAGPRVARHADRLPGRRERLPLRHALLHLARLRALAREGGRLAPARRGQQALLRRPVRARVRPCRWRRPGATGSRSSTSSSAQPRRGPQVPDHAAAATSSRGRWDRSRALFYDAKTAMLYGAFRYPGMVEHVGALDTRDGTSGTWPTSSARCSTACRRWPTTRRAARSSTRTTTSRCAT